MSQLDLFGERHAAVESSPLRFDEAHELKARLPDALRFGTSSWTFEGWSGLVYPQGTTQKSLLARGLELYCQHPLLTTVGIDSSYYRPLSEAALRRYAGQLPPGFLCVSKVSREITTFADPRTHRLNPVFLNARHFEREVLRPVVAGFAEHQGPLIFEFPPFRHPHWLDANQFCERLSGFFSSVSRELPYAVELRNRELLTARYADLLQHFGVDHVFNYWEQMPMPAEQAEVVGPAVNAGVIRLLIPPGCSYGARKRQLQPFNRLVDVRDGMREQTINLVRRFLVQKRVSFVIVNNKAEGCSPLTILGLARRFVGSDKDASAGRADTQERQAPDDQA